MVKRVRLNEALPATRPSPVAKQPSSAPKPPQALAKLFAHPPLIGSEKLEDYQALFDALAADAKPSDTMVWLWVLEVIDRSWDIFRQMRLKQQAIKIAQEKAVAWLLTALSREGYRLTTPPLEAAETARAWAANTHERKKVDKMLAEMGYDEAYVLATAYSEAHSLIDEIDARIASYEARRMKTWIMIEHCNEKLARNLELVSSEIIEGEFREAAE